MNNNLECNIIQIVKKGVKITYYVTLLFCAFPYFGMVRNFPLSRDLIEIRALKKSLCSVMQYNFSIDNFSQIVMVPIISHYK